MKQPKALALALACITHSLYSIPPVTPYYSIRSQGFNTPRHIVGTHNDIHKFDHENVYGSLTVTPEYSRSFDHNSITTCLFGKEVSDCTGTINISGSTAANRNANDWLADYFYLPSDFKSSINIKPIIDHFVVDFNFYLGLDQWVPGMYIALYTPLTHTRWDLNLKETITNFGSSSHPAGYFSANELTTSGLNNQFTQYANGTTPGPIRQTLATRDVIVTLQPLHNAKMSCKDRTRTRLADLRMELGWNILQEDDWHFGIKFHASAPTGNRPNGEYLFEPVAGNGHHWELGGGITTHVNFWQSQDSDKRIGFHLDAIATHLFGARQKRTFDLENKPFSRYMLALRFKDSIDDNLQGGGTTPSHQFGNTSDGADILAEMAPVANLTCRNVDVSVGVQADITAFMNVTIRGFSWDLGYNFWARSCEDITFRCNTATPLEAQNWGLKGDARVFGHIIEGGGATLAAFTPVALSATQSDATINTGLNGASTINANIDNAQLATADTNNVELRNAPAAAAQTQQINTSINPVFLKETQLLACDARTQGMSSKIFTHLHYSWLHRTRWVPSLGIGAHVEFDHDNYSCRTECNNDCPRCAVSNWALWVKGGIAFD